MKLYKSGEQSADDPREFIISTADVDRDGDVVVQDWDLRNFRKNPIALWQHSAAEPIGTWKNVRVEDGRLKGLLDFAAEGTSEIVDKVRKLVDQRIIRAVSVGFDSKEAEPLDRDKPWNGYRLSGNQLFEASLVSVPANQNALAIKSLSEDLREILVEPREVITSAYDIVKQKHAAMAAARKRRNQITRLKVTS